MSNLSLPCCLLSFHIRFPNLEGAKQDYHCLQAAWYIWNSLSCLVLSPPPSSFSWTSPLLVAFSHGFTLRWPFIIPVSNWQGAASGWNQVQCWTQGCSTRCSSWSFSRYTCLRVPSPVLLLMPYLSAALLLRLSCSLTIPFWTFLSFFISVVLCVCPYGISVIHFTLLF